MALVGNGVWPGYLPEIFQLHCICRYDPRISYFLVTGYRLVMIFQPIHAVTTGTLIYLSTTTYHLFPLPAII